MFSRIIKPTFITALKEISSTSRTTVFRPNFFVRNRLFSSTTNEQPEFLERFNMTRDAGLLKNIQLKEKDRPVTIKDFVDDAKNIRKIEIPLSQEGLIKKEYADILKDINKSKISIAQYVLPSAFSITLLGLLVDPPLEIFNHPVVIFPMFLVAFGRFSYLYSIHQTYLQQIDLFAIKCAPISSSEMLATELFNESALEDGVLSLFKPWLVSQNYMRLYLNKSSDALVFDNLPAKSVLHHEEILYQERFSPKIEETSEDDSSPKFSK